MISPETLKSLLTQLGCDQEAITTALDKEKEISLTDLKVTKTKLFTDEEHQTLIDNTTAEVKKYAGTAAIETSIKEYSREHGIECPKTLEGIIKATSEKAVSDAKIPADEKVKTLTADIEGLRTTAIEANKKAETAEQNLVTYKANQANKSELFKSIPDDITKLAGWNKDRLYATAQQEGDEYRRNDKGQLIWYKHGIEQKDELKNPILASERMKVIVNDLGYKPGDGEGGENTDPPGGGLWKAAKTLSEFNAICDKEDCNDVTERDNRLQEIQKENKEFDLDK